MTFKNKMEGEGPGSKVLKVRIFLGCVSFVRFLNFYIFSIFTFVRFLIFVGTENKLIFVVICSAKSKFRNCHITLTRTNAR